MALNVAHDMVPVSVKFMHVLLQLACMLTRQLHVLAYRSSAQLGPAQERKPPPRCDRALSAELVLGLPPNRNSVEVANVCSARPRCGLITMNTWLQT
jgi:hypothetical protein